MVKEMEREFREREHNVIRWPTRSTVAIRDCSDSACLCGWYNDIKSLAIEELQA